MDPTAKVLTLGWSTDYGEMAEVELTRTDGLLWINGTTSISKAKLDGKQIDVFPNPIKDILYLKLEEVIIGSQIFAIDIHGRVLLQKKLQRHLRLICLHSIGVFIS